jgi:energy-coupling factor transporter ATP-binding protein EcfA2
VTFTVKPGIVTGFLEPNGAGKSTTMRMIMGLDRPTAGTAAVNSRPYARHPAPLHNVGALLEARAVHTGRSAYHHLAAMAATTGVPGRRGHRHRRVAPGGPQAGRRLLPRHGPAAETDPPHVRQPYRAAPTNQRARPSLPRIGIVQLRTQKTRRTNLQIEILTA